MKERFCKSVLAQHCFGRIATLERLYGFKQDFGWSQVNGLGEMLNRKYGEYDNLLTIVDLYGLESERSESQ